MVFAAAMKTIDATSVAERKNVQRTETYQREGKQPPLALVLKKKERGELGRRCCSAQVRGRAVVHRFFEAQVRE